MRKFRNASLAIITAGAVALSATPAFAEETAPAAPAVTENAEGTTPEGTTEETKEEETKADPAVPGQIPGEDQGSSNTSSKIGASLEATPEEKAIWGSEKGSSYETGEVVTDEEGNVVNDVKNLGSFTKGWYAYTWIATIAAIAGLVAAAGPMLQQFVNIDFGGLAIKIPGLKF